MVSTPAIAEHDRQYSLNPCTSSPPLPTVHQGWPLIALAATCWPYYSLARLRFALSGQLPWRLQAFLADAHRLGVLRQAGAVYQFRHANLQQRLAHVPDHR
jgi:hypothetical protein